jgi:hypothetical protein
MRAGVLGTPQSFDHRSGSPYIDYTYDSIDRLTATTYHNSDTEGFVMDELSNRDSSQTLRQDGTVHFAVDPHTNRYTAIIRLANYMQVSRM